jgi:uncharacterized protein (DUF433 family)
MRGEPATKSFLGKGKGDIALRPWHTKYLWQNDDRRCGKICIRGRRLALSDILGAVCGETSIERVQESWPDLSKEQIEAALEFIFDLADIARDRDGVLELREARADRA